MSSSLRATFDKEYAAIIEDILKLGSLIDQAIAQALDSLQRRDQTLAQQIIDEDDEPLLKPLIDIPRMAQTAREMLRMSLDAFIERDAEAAKAVVPIDDEMDHLYRAIFDELVEIMSHKPEGVERATYLLWCAHNLERIGDRVTNIAERVIFMTTGDMQELNV